VAVAGGARREEKPKIFETQRNGGSRGDTKKIKTRRRFTQMNADVEPLRRLGEAEEIAKAAKKLPAFSHPRKSGLSVVRFFLRSYDPSVFQRFRKV